MSLVEEKLSDYQIILVSNREPYMHIYREGEVKVIMPIYVSVGQNSVQKSVQFRMNGIVEICKIG